MKKSSIIGVLILCFAFWGKAQVRNEIRVPDPEGYRTLKCDFHIHTVFSDGLVWPTVRVDEAYREGFCLLYTSPAWKASALLRQ